MRIITHCEWMVIMGIYPRHVGFLHQIMKGPNYIITHSTTTGALDNNMTLFYLQFHLDNIYRKIIVFYHNRVRLKV